jgi:predicted amidohydrolase YtcJ
MTSTPAFAAFQEHDLGSLRRPFADFTVLSADRAPPRPSA